jgi:lipopolysaccharide exporter
MGHVKGPIPNTYKGSALLMIENLGHKTLHGLKWTYMSAIAISVIQVGFTAVMARLLDPAAFGLMGMANIMLRFGSYFAQMGVGAAIVQKGTLDNAEIRAGFTLSLIFSVSFFVLTWFFAPLSEYLFQDSEVTPIVRWMAFTFVLTGLSTISLSLLRAQLRFHLLALVDVLSFVAGYVGIGITLAFSGWGVWSLVFCSLAQAFIQVLLCYFFVRHPLLPLFDVQRFRGLFSYGSRLSIISFIQFLYYMIQPVVIGRYFGAMVLGFFSNALRLVNLPLENLVTAVTRVLFPAMSKLQAEPEKIKRAFCMAYTVLAIVVVPISVGILAGAEDIVGALLGPKWEPSIALLRILAIAAPFSLLTSVSGIVYDATVNLTPKIRIEIGSIVGMCIACFGLFRFGVAWVVIGYATVEIARFLLYSATMSRVANLRFADLNSKHVAILANATMVGLPIYGVHWLLFLVGSTTATRMAAEIVVGLIAFVIVTFIWNSRPVRDELLEVYMKTIAGRSLPGSVERFARWYFRKHLAASTSS